SVNTGGHNLNTSIFPSTRTENCVESTVNSCASNSTSNVFPKAVSNHPLVPNTAPQESTALCRPDVFNCQETAIDVCELVNKYVGGVGENFSLPQPPPATSYIPYAPPQALPTAVPYQTTVKHNQQPVGNQNLFQN